MQLLVLLHFHLFLLQLHWSVSSKLGYLFFRDELTYISHPRTSSPMGWGQRCELFLLQFQLQNTRRCCLWSSLNFHRQVIVNCRYISNNKVVHIQYHCRKHITLSYPSLAWYKVLFCVTNPDTKLYRRKNKTRDDY